MHTSLTMPTKARIWSSAAGFSALIFYLIGVAGAVLQFIQVYLPGFQQYMATPQDNLIYLIAFIVNIAVAFFAVLAIFISIFGIPKYLWLVLTFLSLACVVAIPIAFGIMDHSFRYFNLSWFDSFPLDFIGFWAGVGGTFFATFIGIFVPTYY